MNENTKELLVGFVPLVAAAVMFGILLIGARRFAKRREREGLWSKDGPIHPTEPPANFLRVAGYNSSRPVIESETEADDDPLEPHRHNHPEGPG